MITQKKEITILILRSLYKNQGNSYKKKKKIVSGYFWTQKSSSKPEKK